VEVQAADPATAEAALLAFPVVDPPASETFPPPLRQRLERLVEAGELRGQTGSTLVVHLNGELAAQRVAAVGVGSADAADTDVFRTAGSAVARAAGAFGGAVAWLLDPSLPLALEEQLRGVVDGTVLGAYDPARWKTSDPKQHAIESLVLLADGDGLAGVAERTARIAEWANRARDLSNAPPNELMPERLAARAAELGDQFEHLQAEALDREQVVELGMGAFAAVAQGAHNEPRLIVLRYEPPASSRTVTLGLVGKAITFDTGGISLKPGLQMEAMKGDMSGGGAVIEAIGAIADLDLPVRTIGVVAATENMPSGHSYRPGDILRAMNGKTIEVINTDAEGRLVLADALWYAREQGATHLLDLATLTGAMSLALGDLYAGMFANDEDWGKQILEAAAVSGDHLWPFPLHPRYRRYIESTYADMKNASILKQGSPVLAAEFLHEFVGEGPWAHLDIAGPAFLERSRGDYLWQPGGTGYGVRLIAELATRLS
jgi:leucyl aminopeptidase